MLTWGEISASEKYQTLPFEQKEQIRSRFFEDFVIPGAPEGTTREELKRKFDEATVPKRGMLEAAGDIGTSLAKGAAAVGEMAATAHGVATGTMLNNQSREIAKGAGEWWQEKKSDALQQKERMRSERVDESDGILAQAGTAIKETVSDPALLTSFSAEQLPNLAGPAGAGRLTAKFLATTGEKIALKYATAAAVGTGAVMQGADIAGDAYDEAFKAAKAEGLNDQDADSAALTVARKAGAAGAAISVGTNMLPGAKVLERNLAGAGARTTNPVVGAIKGGVGEAVSEALEEGGGKVFSNIAMRDVKPDQDLSKGVGEAAGLGALGGGVMGAVAGAVEKPKVDPVAEIGKASTVDEAIAAAQNAVNAPVDASEFLGEVQAETPAVPAAQPTPPAPAPLALPSPDSPIPGDPTLIAAPEGLRPRTYRDAQAVDQAIEAARAVADQRTELGTAPLRIPTEAINEAPRNAAVPTSPESTQAGQANIAPGGVSGAATQGAAQAPRPQAQEAATADVVTSSGKPFATEKSASIAIQGRKLKGYVATPVEGGWVARKAVAQTATTVAENATPQAAPASVKSAEISQENANGLPQGNARATEAVGASPVAARVEQPAAVPGRQDVQTPRPAAVPTQASAEVAPAPRQSDATLAPAPLQREAQAAPAAQPAESAPIIPQTAEKTGLQDKTIQPGGAILSDVQREHLQGLSEEIGWAERGGKMIRNQDGDVTARTKWIAKSPFWPQRPSGVTEATARTAVRKAVTGEKLNAAERRFVEYAKTVIDNDLNEQQAGTIAELSDANEMGIALEIAALLEQDGTVVSEADFLRELGLTEDEINETRDQATDQGQAAEGAEGTPRRGAEGGAQTEEGFALKAESEQDIAARESASANAEIAKTASERKADERAQADRERDSFGLTGSDRPADSNPDQTPLFSRSGDSKPKSPADFWTKYAKRPDAFKYGKSDAQSIEQIAKDYEAQDLKLSAKERRFATPSLTELGEYDVLKLPVIEMEVNGEKQPYAEIHPMPGDRDGVFIRINESDSFERGQGGAAAYQMLMTWAVNNDKTLYPDTDLLPVNRLRRSEAMISTLLKYGEKSDIRPHFEQYAGMLDDADYAQILTNGKESVVPEPIKARLKTLAKRMWKDPNSAKSTEEKSAIFRTNLDNLLVASSVLAHRRVPELAEVSINEAGVLSNFFEDEHGPAGGSQSLGSLGLPESAYKVGVGATTAVRAIVTRELAYQPQLASEADATGVDDSGMALPWVEWASDRASRRGVLEAGNAWPVQVDLGEALSKNLQPQALYRRISFPKDIKARESGLSVSGVQELAKKLGVDVRVVENTEDLPADALEKIKSENEVRESRGDDPLRPRGVFLPKTGEIVLVSGNLTSMADATFTIAHEAAHRGLRRMFGKEMGQALNTVYLANENVRKRVAEMMKPIDQGGFGIGQQEAIEETIADLADKGKAHNLKGWKRIVEAIQNFMRRAGLTIKLSDTQVEMIAAAASRMGAKEGAQVFDGEPRQARAVPTPTSTPQTESEAFKKWFGDSKVVDDKGEPLVVYHGTAKNFSVFNPKKAIGGQFWFTTDKASIERGEAGAQGKGVIVDAYLSIKNPAGWKEYDKLTLDQLISRGYDGLMLKDGDETTFVAFDNKQIKSASRNRGTFDPESPNILFSRSGNAAQAATKPADEKMSPSGPIDSLMASMGGKAIAEKITKPMYDRVTGEIGKRIPEKIKAGIVSDYGLPEPYIQERDLTRINQRKGIAEAKSAVEKLATLSRAESRVAYQWMNRNDAEGDRLLKTLPAESQATLRELKTTITGMGKEAVDLGLLSEETFARSQNAYLHRTYAKHELEETKQEKVSRARAIKVLGEQFKGRGLVDYIDEAKIGADRKGEKFDRYERRDKNGALREVVYLERGKPLNKIQAERYADWTKDGVWEARFDTKPGKIGMWRDFTPEERQRMGELDEVKYSVAKTLMMMTRDIETAKLLRYVSKNYAQEDAAGLNVVEAPQGNLLSTFGKDDWVRVPETKIPKTDVKVYGDLGGQYIPAPMWNDLRQVASSKFNPLGDVYGSILRAWKMSKTVMSPAVWTNNVMSNFILADLADIGVKDILKTTDTYFKGKFDKDADAAKLLKRYENSGGELGAFAINELQRETLEPLLDDLRKEIRGAENLGVAAKAASVVQAIAHGNFREAYEKASTTKGFLASKKGVEALTKFYQSQDEFFRFAAWMKAVNEGKSDIEAGRIAREAFLDYSINAPWIQNLRSTVLPFVSYVYRALPLLGRAAAEKPWKLAKYFAVAGGLNALAYAMVGGDEDKERKLLPEEKSGKAWGLFPRLMRMPWNDANENPVFLDVRRWIPAGDAFDTTQGHSAMPIPASFNLGGPLMMMAELYANRQNFTGKDITLDTDEAHEKALKIADHIYKSMAPNVPFLPGSYSYSSIKDASKGVTDKFGREQSVGQALSSAAGVKLAAYPEDVLLSNLTGKLSVDLLEVDKDFAAAKRQFAQNKISQDELDTLTERYAAKKTKIREAYAKKVD